MEPLVVVESSICGEMRKRRLICGRSGQIKVAVAQRVSSSRIMCQNGVRVIRIKELYTGLVAEGATDKQLVIVPDKGILYLDGGVGTSFDMAEFHKMIGTEKSGTGCVPSA